MGLDPEIPFIMPAPVSYDWSERALVYLTLAEHAETIDEVAEAALIYCGFDLLNDREFWDHYKELRFGPTRRKRRIVKHVLKTFKQFLRTGNRGVIRG